MSAPTTIIIGGGVTGSSIAHHLARRSHGCVIILKKGTVGEGSSHRTAGITTGLLRSKTGEITRKIGIKSFRVLSQSTLPGLREQAVGRFLPFWSGGGSFLTKKPLNLWLALRHEDPPDLRHECIGYRAALGSDAP